MATRDQTVQAAPPRSATGALMAVSEAVGRLTAAVTPVAPVSLSLGEAVGTTLAGDVLAPADVPALAIAWRDGWAVTAETVTGASPHSPILLARKPVWIEAGDALPSGTDTILTPEAIPDPDAERGRMVVVEEAPEGEGIRPAGIDLREGIVLGKAGTRLALPQILGIAASGITEVDVRRPVIRLVATGPAGAAVCVAIAARVVADGGKVEATVAVPGDADAIAAAILGGPADAVFVVGGTGFGDGDRSAAGLDLAGTVTAHGLALRPGETTGFGTAAGRTVILLPGRADAALAAYLALGRPLLAALAGTETVEPAVGRLLRKVVSTLGMCDLVFVRRTPDGIDPLGGAGIPLHRLSLADGALLVPPAREGYGDGTRIEIVAL